ncbi:glycylpeptide N-tetradecanoyltransferase [Batrachochytrium dendrobatidis]
MTADGKQAADSIKSSKESAASTSTAASQSQVDVQDKASVERIEKIMEKLNTLKMMQSPANEALQKKLPKEDMSQYRFWNTQPVARTDEEVSTDGVIEPNKQPEEIQQDPYPLHKEFEWTLLNFEDEQEIKDVYQLLSANYVEDDEATLRFDYSAEFLKWALMPPGWRSDWHVGVRAKTSKKLVGFIGATPATVNVRTNKIPMVEINFLCVHKKLRSKRLAPVLIKEITRRVNLAGIFQAAYTAGVYLPTPVSTCRYYHRSLNPKKLVDTGFSYIPRNMTMARMIRLYKMPDEPKTPGVRPMTLEDVPQVKKLMSEYLSRFELFHDMTEEEIAHWILPVDKVMYSYVVYDDQKKKVTDFFSFYSLPSTVIGNPVHSHINAAYLFHYAPMGMGEDPARIQLLINDALILAKKAGFDVFNCLEFMDNHLFLEELKFGKGNGDLNFYLYNYRSRNIDNKKVALFMV